jgi:hypothetical protein
MLRALLGCLVLAGAVGGCRQVAGVDDFSVDPRCDGWMDDPATLRCYRLFDGEFTQDAGQEACEKRGSSLAAITSKSEYDWVSSERDIIERTKEGATAGRWDGVRLGGEYSLVQGLTWSNGEKLEGTFQMPWVTSPDEGCIVLVHDVANDRLGFATVPCDDQTEAILCESAP